jgi:hypothetical protein
VEQQSAVKVIDPDSGGEAWVFTRLTGTTVGLALSIEDDGDMEVFLPAAAALQVAAALTEAARTLVPER